MVLVLAFSLQGTVDAQRVTEVSGDHQNQVPSLPFNSPLVFTISDVTAANETPAATGTLGTPPAPPTISAASLITITGTGVTINGVTISGKTTTTTTTLNQPKVYSPAVTTTTHADAAERTALSTGLNTYNNANTTLRVGSNTITVRLTAGASASSSATVAVASGGTTLKTFTFYVAATPAATALFDPASPTTTGVYTNTIASSVEGQISFATQGATADNMLVDFSILSGSGGLYFDADDRNRNTSRRNQTVGVDSSAAAIRFRPPGSGVTIIQAAIRGTNQRAYRTLFSNFPNVSKVEDVSGRTGVIGTRLPDPFIVEVRDGETGARVPNQNVRFSVSFSGGGNANLPHQNATATMPATATMLTSTADSTQTIATTAVSSASITLDLQTDSRGRAGVYLTMGVDADPVSPNPRTDVGTYMLRAQLTDTPPTATPTIWDTETFTAQSVGETTEAIIEIASGNNQRVDPVTGAPDEQLVVSVLNRHRQIVRGEPVTFRATVGTLTGDAARVPTGGTATGQFVTQTTDEFGQAAVAFVIGDTSGDAEVRAVINPATQHEQGVTFTVNGRGGGNPQPPQPPQSPQPPQQVIANVPSSVSGTTDGTTTLRFTAPAGASVSIGELNDTFPIENASLPVRSGNTVSSTLTLPSQVRDYSLTVFVDRVPYSVSVRVTAPTAPTGGTVTVRIQPSSGGPGTQATVTVTATPAARVSIPLGITAGGGTLSPLTVTTGTNGIGTATLTRGSTPGSNYFITATPPTGYTFRSALTSGERVIILGTPPTTTPGTTTLTTAGEPASLSAYEGNNQEGSPNIRLLSPLVVEVVDANDNPVSNVRVRFRTTIGSGTFTPRTSRTDTDGFAEVRFTPTSTGRIRVVASVTGVSRNAVFFVQGGELASGLVKVSGDSQNGTQGEALSNPFIVEVQDADGEPLSDRTVSFHVTAGGGSLSEASVRTGANGRAETLLTLGNQRGVHSVQASVPGVDPVTFTARIEPQILVAAANRPVMYWTDGGMLYRLAEKVEHIAVSLENATSWAIGGDKLYWTMTNATNPNRGTLNRANLDGSGATELNDIYGAPYEIAVDVTKGKLYWTDSLNRIQQSDLSGQNIKNAVRDISGLGTLAVAAGNVYWTEAAGRIRSANINGGTPVTPTLASGLGEVLSLAVGGNKLYWLERAANGSGKLQRANLDGTGVEVLKSFTRLYDNSLSVDTTRQHLYLAGSGKVSRRNLTGTGYQVVVSGLGNPMSIAIGGEAPAGTSTQTPTTTTPTTPTASASKYDVNADGSVDSKDIDVLIVAILAELTDDKYDVNDDGKVDVSDVKAVNANLDAGAASAPTLLGMKFTAIERDRLQEQVDLLIATGDRSPAALKTLIYLQQLIVMARPEKTQLLANYPNPFNPETWIPYELATDTDVRITIYNAQGVVIRTLQLGQQSAGYYTDRERAAYWDGRNALGEQVASGIYFYQLETDEMSTLRKMVILK